MTKDLRRHIVGEHNRLRNQLACGKTKGANGTTYPKAGRQRVLFWDWELAYTAEDFCKQASFGHSHCRSSPKHKYVGQNIAESQNQIKDGQWKDLISSWMNSWFTNEARRVLTPSKCVEDGVCDTIKPK